MQVFIIFITIDFVDKKKKENIHFSVHQKGVAKGGFETHA